MLNAIVAFGIGVLAGVVANYISKKKTFLTAELNNLHVR